MNAIEVSDKSSIKEFLNFPVRLYKNDEHWIRPFDTDIEKVFAPKENKYFRHGECTRWIFTDDKGNTIGRVAAFINKKGMKSKNSEGQELITGGMGFFECVEDKEIANLIFDHCATWLKERDCNVMEGPINFGERDNWWGLLYEGFDIDPNYCMPYTKKYYVDFFESYGFQDYFQQWTFGRGVNDELGEKFYDKAARIQANPKYSFSCLNMKELEKYTEDFRIVYNAAWTQHAGVKEMSTLQAKTIMKSMKPILDPDIMYFVYYEGNPVGFFFNMMDVNQMIRSFSGKLNLVNKLRFLYQKVMKTNKKMVGRGFGIAPEHQGKGLEGAIVMYCRKIVQEEIRGRYTEYEMNWIGDFNPTMVKVAATIGDVIKRHVTYRKMLDDSLTFERCKVIK